MNEHLSYILKLSCLNIKSFAKYVFIYNLLRSFAIKVLIRQKLAISLNIPLLLSTLKRLIYY